jgi:tetratricopeptide (TPR) repeat protein
MSTREDPHTLLQQATLYANANLLPQAISTYERLLSQWPDLPNSWYNLAYLQRRAGQYECALNSYQAALDRGVDQPEEVHLNRGAIFSDVLNRGDEARRELSRALQLNPNYAPALLNLANINEEHGDRETALALYQRLLEVEPNHHEGLARYASLCGIGTAGDPLVQRLRGAIKNPRTSNAHRAALGFGLGKLLNDCGEYDQAFEAYRTGNLHSSASAESAAALYEPDAHSLFVSEIMRVFASRDDSSVKTVWPAPIFICGMFRSGSTLAEQVLARHSRVGAAGEIDFIPQLVRTQLAPYPASRASQSNSQLAAYAEQYRSRLAAVAPGAEHVTDKRPDNFLHVGLIKTLFPNAKIVHTTRNPLDNALSVYFLHLDHSMGYALDLTHIGHYYREYRRLMTHWKCLYGDDILDFDYDVLVEQARPAVASLLNFCGLEWEESCMSFGRVDAAVRTASLWQVRQPLYRHASGRWKNYEQHLGPLRAALGYL